MYYQLTLSGRFTETGPQSGGLLNSLNEGKRLRYDHLYTEVHRLAGNRRIETVLVNVESDCRLGSLSAAVSIGSLLMRLREAGKKLVFYAREYGISELYLASLCDERLLHPLGFVSHLGVSRSFLFFRELMDRRRIKVDILRIGRYKSAGDSFRVSSLDEYNRQQMEDLLTNVNSEYETRIARGYDRPVEDVSALRDGRILGAEAAREAGWVTRSATLDDILAEFAEAKKRPLRTLKERSRTGRGKKVAVLVFEGGIKDGDNGSSPLLGQMIGASDYVPVIRKIRKDRSVAAVIFRVNSGGGSASASEDIARELARLGKKKPLVVSMGEVAGSGGYWISLDSQRIFAEPCGVTGSIGVVSLHFNIGEFLGDYGVTHSTVKVGEHADIEAAYRDLSEDERALFMGQIRELYDKFREKVAESRGMSVEQVHALGEGHIYAAGDALEKGLVDELGGIDAALKYLGEQLKSSSLKVEFLPRRRKSRLVKMLGGGSGKQSPYAEFLPGTALTAAASAPELAAMLADLQHKALAVTPGFMDSNGVFRATNE